MVDKPSWMTPKGPAWQRLSHRPVYENPWITVDEFDAVAPTGAKALYGLVGMKNLALGILPLHSDGTVTLVGQHRFPSGTYSWEIPEGGGAKDIDPLTSAQRELREEAGLEAREWIHVLDFDVSNSITDERGLGFLALDLSPVPVEPDDTEVFAMARVPFKEALAVALAGHMRDLITLAMLLRAHHLAVNGEIRRDLAELMLG
jgi:8-oxo-dGTP pyrophosphatase MutT (NUDIX family)